MIRMFSDTLLLADVFENFRNMCLEIYELDPSKFLSTPGLDLLADINMLIMVEKGSRGGICHSIYRYTKANNKYRKDTIKIKNRHIFNIVM